MQAAEQETPYSFKHNHGVVQVAYSPDGNQLAALSGCNTIIMHNVKDRQLTGVRSAHGRVFGMAFKTDGALAVVGPDSLGVLGAQDLKVIAGVAQGFFSPIAMCADNSLIALSKRERYGIQLVNAVTLDEVSFLSMPSQSIGGIAFHPHEKVLAVGAFACPRSRNTYGIDTYNDPMPCIDEPTVMKVTVFDMHTSQLSCEYTHGDGAAAAVEFNRAGNLVSAATRDTAVMWDIRAQKKVAVLREAPVSMNWEGHILSIAFDRGHLLATGLLAETIRLWDLRQNQVCNEFRGSGYGLSHRINSVAFSPDGSQLASGSANGIVRIWDK